MNTATEKLNLTAETGNGHKHQQNREKNSEKKIDEEQNKERKKRKISFHIR